VVVWGFAGGQRKKRREHLIIEAGHGEPLDGAGCEMDGLDLLPPGCSLSFSWRERRGARELEGARLVHFFLEKGLVTPSRDPAWTSCYPYLSNFILFSLYFQNISSFGKTNIEIGFHVYLFFVATTLWRPKGLIV